ncbi:MAG: CDP-alcohol phosphatidyltransferase family protein [Candidatus Aminicenantes bacterium]|nr:MAG: CDP-alcohol phosphatidyltransferase family protein [Candidatus Aminicenantes bacterium]
MDNEHEERNRFLTIPNILSISRILLVPVFLVMIIQGKAFEALAVFLLAGSTDLLDGLIARQWHQKTKIGTLLDPAADKLLATPTFIVLSLSSLKLPNIIPVWLTISVIGRDVLIITGALVAFKLRGQKSFNPSIFGKASTVCQFSVIFFVLLLNYVQKSPLYLSWLYVVTLFFTLVSGIHYVMIGSKMILPSKQS